jgi:hypothetical protein
MELLLLLLLLRPGREAAATAAAELAKAWKGREAELEPPTLLTGPEKRVLLTASTCSCTLRAALAAAAELPLSCRALTEAGLGQASGARAAVLMAAGPGQLRLKER